MRTPEIEQIAAVTSSWIKANAYRKLFDPIPVVQAWPQFDEKKLAQAVPLTIARAQILSQLKAKEDLRNSVGDIFGFTAAATWWANHTIEGADTIKRPDGKTWAMFHDVHNFIPETGEIFERPESEAEWFAQMRASAGKEVWLIAGHTLMKLGGTFPCETVGIVTKAHVRNYSEEEIVVLRKQLETEENLLHHVGAGSLSLPRNAQLFDTNIPLEVWLYRSIENMDSGEKIATISDWGNLEKPELWRITFGIWPEVKECLTEKLV